ncbi:hypothetical protein [Pseudoduganella rhizocola]|uniref:hypothetical protein n=1 Tax=Pseudoduganella rhizocola TaxID=3382643 RepID=UPI0038B5F036
MHKLRTLAAILTSTIVLGACGGGGGSGGSGGGIPGGGNVMGGNHEPQRLNVAVKDSAVLKARVSGAGWIALLEKPHRIFDGYNAPERSLLFSGGARYLPPAGWHLIDFDVHPSGQVSAVLVGERDVQLVRLDAGGTVLHSAPLDDPQHLADAYYGSPEGLADPGAMHPFPTLDTARLAATGEEIVLLLRTGRNALVAYRLAQAAGAVQMRWRTLVEPGTSIVNVWLTGTHDPYGDLQHQWRAYMDVDAQGRVAIAAPVNLTYLNADHARHFNEPLLAGPWYGSLLTILDANGARQRSTIVNTRAESQLTTVRWTGPDAVALAGRIRTARDNPAGWDGYVARVQPSSRTVQSMQAVDFEGGDVILELAPLPGGRLLAGGASNYTQNTAGASISETAAPLLAILDQDGKLVRRLPVEGGPRQNQVRALAPFGKGWLAGGMRNGPGTHSADGAENLILADGWLREVAVD